MLVTSSGLKDWMPGKAPASLKADGVLVFGQDDAGINALAFDVARTYGSPVRIKADGDMTAQQLNALLNTGSLFGAPDPVLVEGVKETHFKILESVLGGNQAPLIVTAGNLKKTGKTVKLFDERGAAAQIFTLENNATVDWLKKCLDTIGFSLEQSAGRLAQAALSGNRMEIMRLAEVLSLSAAGRGSKTVNNQDMIDIVPDLTDIDLGGALDAAIEGDLAKALTRFDRQLASGENPITLFRLWGFRLGRLDAMAATGQDPKTAVSKARPPIFWKDKAFFEKALRKLGMKGIGTLVKALDAAEYAAVEKGQPTRILAERVLTTAATYKG